MTQLLTRQKAIKLREQGKTYSEIKRKLDIPKSTLSDWLHNFPLTSDQFKELEKSIKFNKHVAIEKIRIANIGRKVSEETRKKIGEASRGREVRDETREKLRKANTGRKIVLCEESKEKIRCAARYKRTEDHKNNLRNINKGNKYHSYTWKVTLPDNTVKFTKTLSDVINDDKLIRALKLIRLKLRSVKDKKNYDGFTFPHQGYTIQKCNKVYSGLIDEITALNSL